MIDRLNVAQNYEPLAFPLDCTCLFFGGRVRGLIKSCQDSVFGCRKDRITMRILHSGSKAQDQGDSRLQKAWSVGSLCLCGFGAPSGVSCSIENYLPLRVSFCKCVGAVIQNTSRIIWYPRP